MQKCAVSGCEKPANYEVILYDFYTYAPVCFESDFTCPFICHEHALENEREAMGAREPRGRVEYLHTNRNRAQGFTIYKPLEPSSSGVEKLESDCS